MQSAVCTVRLYGIMPRTHTATAFVRRSVLGRGATLLGSLPQGPWAWHTLATADTALLRCAGVKYYVYKVGTSPRYCAVVEISIL